MSNKTRYVKVQKDDLEGKVLPESVEAWESAGWTVVDDGNSEEPSQGQAVGNTQQPRLGTDAAPKSAQANDTKE